MTALVHIKGNAGTLSGEYADGGSVDLGRIRNIRHDGSYQSRPLGLDGLIDPGNLYFVPSNGATIWDAFTTNQRIRWHLAVEDGDLYEFDGILTPGDITRIRLSGEIKRLP